jgi:hypothetical protein
MKEKLNEELKNNYDSSTGLYSYVKKTKAKIFNDNYTSKETKI